MHTAGEGLELAIPGDPSISKGGSHFSKYAKGECVSKDTHRQLCPGLACGLQGAHALRAPGSPGADWTGLPVGFQIPSSLKNICSPWALHPRIPDQEALP